MPTGLAAFEQASNVEALATCLGVVPRTFEELLASPSGMMH